MLLKLMLLMALVLFAALGMADAADWLMRAFRHSRVPCVLLAVVPVRAGDADGIEARVRGVLAEAGWSETGASCRVLLTDCGAGPEETLLCRRLELAFDAVEFLPAEQLGEVAARSLQSCAVEL